MKTEPNYELFAPSTKDVGDGMISLAEALAQADLDAELDEEL